MSHTNHPQTTSAAQPPPPHVAVQRPLSPAPGRFNAYDAEIAEVIKTYSQGRRSPCLSSSNGPPSEAPLVPEASGTGAFLMEVHGGSETAAVRSSQYSAPYSPDHSSPSNGADGDQDGRRASIFADALHLARDIHQHRGSPIDESGCPPHTTTSPRRAHTYYAGQSTPGDPRVFSYGPVTHVAAKPHATFDPEAVKAMLEAKEKRRLEAAAAAAAAATAATHSAEASDVRALEEEVAHNEGADHTTSAPIVTKPTPSAVQSVMHSRAAAAPSSSSSCPGMGHAPRATSISLAEPDAPPFGSASRSNTSVRQHSTEAAATLARGTPTELFSAKADLTPPQGRSPAPNIPSAPPYYSPMLMQPQQPHPILFAAPSSQQFIASDNFAAPSSVQDHYTQYMWSCALYYSQCMASMQQVMPTNGTTTGAPVYDPATFAGNQNGVWGSSMAFSVGQSLPTQPPQSRPDTSFAMTGGFQAQRARTAAHAPTYTQVPFPTPCLVNQPLAASSPMMHTGVVSLLPVKQSDVRVTSGAALRHENHAHTSATDTNESSAMTMNYVTGASLMSVTDPATSTHQPQQQQQQTQPQQQQQQHSRASRSRASRAEKTAEGPRRRTHAHTSAPARPSLSSIPADDSAAKGKSASTRVFPAEMRYSQTDPFSTYMHNKKMLGSTTTCVE